jgi:cation transport regulator ChaC
MLTRWRYRRFGVELAGRPADEIWHFAYGSNMNQAVFCTRRGMQPLEWRAGCLAGYRLRFNLDGRPLGRAAPANIAPDPAGEVWGVLYRITRADLVHLDSTEGVPNRGRYRHLHAEAHDEDGNRFAVVTYMADGNAHDGNPSLRYITLLRDGARVHGLPAHYIEFLDNVKPAV